MTELRSGPHSAVPLITGELPAAPEHVERIRCAIAHFAAENGATGQLLANIALAVSEAATNVVRHAYLPGRKGAIDYAADVEDGSLEIVIADDGEGIRPGPAEGSGLGLVIVSSVSADFAIRERRPRGTELWMSFLLDA